MSHLSLRLLGGFQAKDHFANLKVGPALSYTFREVAFSLAMMEEELLASKAGTELSWMRGVLDEAMMANPVYWRKYYGGDERAQASARKYSFSDSIDIPLSR